MTAYINLLVHGLLLIQLVNLPSVFGFIQHRGDKGKCLKGYHPQRQPEASCAYRTFLQQQRNDKSSQESRSKKSKTNSKRSVQKRSTRQENPSIPTSAIPKKGISNQTKMPEASNTTSESLNRKTDLSSNVTPNVSTGISSQSNQPKTMVFKPIDKNETFPLKSKDIASMSTQRIQVTSVDSTKFGKSSNVAQSPNNSSDKSGNKRSQPRRVDSKSGENNSKTIIKSKGLGNISTQVPMNSSTTTSETGINKTFVSSQVASKGSLSPNNNSTQVPNSKSNRKSTKVEMKTKNIPGVSTLNENVPKAYPSTGQESVISQSKTDGKDLPVVSSSTLNGTGSVPITEKVTISKKSATSKKIASKTKKTAVVRQPKKKAPKVNKRVLKKMEKNQRALLAAALKYAVATAARKNAVASTVAGPNDTQRDSDPVPTNTTTTKLKATKVKRKKSNLLDAKTIEKNQRALLTAALKYASIAAAARKVTKGTTRPVTASQPENPNRPPSITTDVAAGKTKKASKGTRNRKKKTLSEDTESKIKRATSSKQMSMKTRASASPIVETIPTEENNDDRSNVLPTVEKSTTPSDKADDSMAMGTKTSRSAPFKGTSTSEVKKTKEIDPSKYSSITDLGERAFAILRDIGAIETSVDPSSPDYDSSKDDDIATENVFVNFRR